MPKRLLIFLFLAGLPALAEDPDGFLGDFTYPEPSGAKSHGFTMPNEWYPQDAKPIFEKLGRGAYLSVGTERGLIHFSLSPQVTHLIQLDRDPAVARFNQINRMLLCGIDVA